MSSLGGLLSARSALLGCGLLAFAVSGCVRDAVLENDVQRAQVEAQVLTTESDLELAEAALSAQLIELEALRLRSHGDARVLQLLHLGYARLADGFIEGARLEALIAGDAAEATRLKQRQANVWERAMFYRKQAGGYAPPASFNRPGDSLAEQRELASADEACQKHDRARYEAVLTGLLAKRATLADHRLSLALAQRLARSRLHGEISAACQF